MDELNSQSEQEKNLTLLPKKKGIIYYLIISVLGLVIFFIISLFVSPYFHPTHLVTKVGIITNVETYGDPVFNQTVYILTFQDGQVISVKTQNSVPFLVGKPIEIIYIKRGHELYNIKYLQK
jgi:hypothetical protein